MMMNDRTQTLEFCRNVIHEPLGGRLKTIIGQGQYPQMTLGITNSYA